MLIYTSRSSCKLSSKRTSSKTPIAQVHKISSLTSSLKSTFTPSYTIPSSLTAFSLSQKINLFSRSQKCWPQPLSTSITGNARIYLEELCHWGHLHSTLNNFDDDDYIGLLNLPLWTLASGAGNIALPMDLASQLDTWWQSSTVHSYSDATCSSIDTSNI